MSRFKITITFKAEELRDGLTLPADGGNSAEFINYSVSATTRHLMQKSLMEKFSEWGDQYLIREQGIDPKQLEDRA